MDELLHDIQHQEVLLWSLLNAILTTRARFDSLPLKSTHFHETCDAILRQYEAWTWQIAPIQVHLRVKLSDHTAFSGQTKPPTSPASNATAATDTITDGLPCPECGKIFACKEYLAKHRRMHIDMPFMCRLCDTTFVHPTKFENHKQRHIAAGEIYDESPRVCRLCRQKFATAQLLEDHFAVSHVDSLPYACSECDREYRTEYKLKYHIEGAHVGEDKQPFECDTCRKRFSHKSKLRVHLKSHLNRTIDCKECGKSLASEISLKAHIRRSHLGHTETKKFLCAECGMRFHRRFNYEQHLRTHTDERPFACTECKYRAKTAKSLTVHMCTHTGERAYKCSHCDRSFATSDARRLHLARLDKAHACTYCDKTFAMPNLLRDHLPQHTGEKPFACPDCDEQFISRHTRLMHQRKVHNRDTPYKCNICQQQFDNRRLLKSHAVQHTGIKPFACDECDRRYTTEQALAMHQGLCHGDAPLLIKCNVCAKLFKGRASLQRHMQTHTGNKPFTCDVCQKAFADSHTVTIHMRLHTGEKPFECDVCDKRFIDKRDVNKHKKRAHDKMK